MRAGSGRPFAPLECIVTKIVPFIKNWSDQAVGADTNSSCTDDELSLGGGALALEDVDDECGFALCGPALWTVGIGLDLDGGRCGGGFGLA